MGTTVSPLSPNDSSGNGGDGGGIKLIEPTVNNVVCSFSTRCHLNLRRIAMEGFNVEFRRDLNVVNMKLRKPNTTATIWSSGKITCVGAKSEQEAYKSARRFCRLLQHLKFKVRLFNYRVVNVLCTYALGFSVDLKRLANDYKNECSYEPELHPGASFKMEDIKSTLKLFTTGSVTITAPSVDASKRALNQMQSILLKYKYRSEAEKKLEEQQQQQLQLQQLQQQQAANNQTTLNDPFQATSLNDHHGSIKFDYLSASSSINNNNNNNSHHHHHNHLLLNNHHHHHHHNNNTNHDPLFDNGNDLLFSSSANLNPNQNNTNFYQTNTSISQHSLSHLLNTTANRAVFVATESTATNT